MAQTRLDRARTNFADGLAAARECRADLEWTGARVDSLNQQAAQRWPRRYADVDRRIPRIVDAEE